jgi:hypothetical protein
MNALWRSIFLNVICPYLLYRLLAPRFLSGSLLPLALSSVPPLLGLVYGLIRQRTIDFIAFFAAEDIAVSMVSLMLAHTEVSALVGRSLQNAVLGVIFLGSLALSRPLVLYIARQFVTGNDSQARERFDLIVNQPDARKVYRNMTWVWAVAMFAKSAGSVLLALIVPAQNYLVFSPIWTYGSDALLVWWSVNYGYRKLRHYADEAETLPEKSVTNALNGAF